MTRLLAIALLVVATALPARAAGLAVFTAASLTEVIDAIQADFEKTHPGTEVAVTSASSGELLARMRRGAAADVFVSADVDTMDEAARQKVVDPASRTIIAGNDLVLAVPAGNPAKVADLEDLTRGGVRRVGVGNPESVPAGRYAKRALSQKALWFALAAKLVYFPSVRHVLAALADRSIDAGFVYRTDAVLAGKAVAVATSLPLSPPVRYMAALGTTGTNTQEGAAFLAYLTTPAVRERLAAYGFTVP